MTDDEIEKWARAYVDAELDPTLLTEEEHPLFWAVERFMYVGDDVDPWDCWKAILCILAMNPPDKVIGNLAAGPLEDLIEQCGEEFIDMVELEAHRNPSFRHLLGGVWKSSTTDVWTRIENCRGEPW